MKTGLMLGIVLTLSGASAAMAACGDDVGKLEMQSREKEKSAIQQSSGGQADAARQQAQHGTGDAASQSAVAINDAKVAAGKGDEAGCQAALAKARRMLDQ